MGVDAFRNDVQRYWKTYCDTKSSFGGVDKSLTLPLWLNILLEAPTSIDTSFKRSRLRISQEYLVDYNISTAWIGEPLGTYLATPPGTLHTSLVTKKDQRLAFLQCSESFSRSKSSPIGIPHPLRRISWRDHSF